MDLARALRDAGVVVVSGFHSPLERDCFEFLIRGDLAGKALAWGKPVVTFAIPDTENLVALGAEPLGIGEIVSRCRRPPAAGSGTADTSRGQSHGQE